MKNEKITSEEVRRVFLWEGWGLKEFFLLMRGEALLLVTGAKLFMTTNVDGSCLFWVGGYAQDGQDVDKILSLVREDK